MTNLVNSSEAKVLSFSSSGTICLKTKDAMPEISGNIYDVKGDKTLPILFLQNESVVEIFKEEISYMNFLNKLPLGFSGGNLSNLLSYQKEAETAIRKKMN